MSSFFFSFSLFIKRLTPALYAFAWVGCNEIVLQEAFTLGFGGGCFLLSFHLHFFEIIVHSFCLFWVIIHASTDVLSTCKNCCDM